MVILKFNISSENVGKTAIQAYSGGGHLDIVERLKHVAIVRQKKLRKDAIMSKRRRRIGIATFLFVPNTVIVRRLRKDFD